MRTWRWRIVVVRAGNEKGQTSLQQRLALSTISLYSQRFDTSTCSTTLLLSPRPPPSLIAKHLSAPRLETALVLHFLSRLPPLPPLQHLQPHLPLPRTLDSPSVLSHLSPETLRPVKQHLRLPPRFPSPLQRVPRVVDTARLRCHRLLEVLEQHPLSRN